MRWPTITPTRNRIAVLGLSALGLTVCSVVGIGDSWAPDGRAATSAPLPFPTTDQADDPVARGGPLGGALALPELVPAGTPVWEPTKGTVIADGQALPRTTARVVAAQVAAADPERVTPDPAEPEPAPAPAPTPVVGLPPVVVEPRDCTDPLVECECDHDVATDCAGNPRTPFGLPPVVDEEDPVVDEEPASEPPAGDETPVVDIGILTPDPAEATP